MTDPDPAVVDAVEAFVTRHGADPEAFEASGLRTIVGASREEITAGLQERAARRNGPGPHQ